MLRSLKTHANVGLTMKVLYWVIVLGFVLGRIITSRLLWICLQGTHMRQITYSTGLVKSYQ